MYICFSITEREYQKLHKALQRAATLQVLQSFIIDIFISSMDYISDYMPLKKKEECN